jgi:FKBP-type peptidyl-prolyl cis-trans isomerase
MNLRLPVALALLAATASIAWSQTRPPVTATGPVTATAPSTAPAFKNDKEKVGYALGMRIGRKVSADLEELDYDPAMLVEGVKDVLAGGTPRMTDAQVKTVMDDLQKTMEAKAAAEDAKLAETNQKAGDAFLAENAKKEGVKTTPSGLQYKVLKAGTGKVSPKATDTVSVRYKGTLVSGKQFDASGDKAVSFPLNRVIKGWTEGMQLMKVGDTFQFVIPPKLAYEDSPPPGAPIGPNEVLVFEVELLDIK